MHERNVIYSSYCNDGFLGRALLYMIDKMITGCIVTFEY